MNTLFLKYAIEINKTQSITKAAENLYMQQPNLSKALRELEESLGYQIFDRTGKGIIPTKEGNIFLSYARDILDKINELQTLSDVGKGDENRIRISIPRGSYIANGFSEFVLEQSQKETIDFSVCETNSMQAIDNLVEHNFNLGIIRYSTKYEQYFLDYLKSKDVQSEMIWEFRYLVVMSKDGSISNKNEVYLRDLDDLIEICHGDIEIPYYSGSAMFEKNSTHNKRINVFERGSQFDILSMVPNTYMWVSPIPDTYLDRYGVIQRKCNTSDGRDGSNKYKDVLIYRKGYTFSELDKKFQTKLYESKLEVSSREYN